MSDLLLNLDTALPQRPKKSSEGNKKHQRFVRRRHFLERKGFLKQKQLPAQAPLPKRDASRGGAGVDQERDKKKQKASCVGAGVDQERDKKKQKVDWQDGLFGRDRVGKEDRALREDGSAQQAEMPKGTANHCAKDSGPPSKAPPVTSRMGGASARQNGAWVSRSAGEKASLLSEFESGLPAAAPALTKPNKMVAIDCEMVGTGPGGRNSELARCSVVSYHGDLMYDKFIRPVNPITNFRTRWSGIRRHHMRNAVPFKMAQKEILKLLSGKIVIGHAIYNDFKALKYFHPKSLTRDTSKIPLLNRKAGFSETEAASLKRLTKQLLHRDIQVGQHGHSSVEDAQATMELYKLVEAEWERHLALPPAQD